jgi:peptidoglycan/LPS O-acetylase OafA/YrhL
MSHDELPPESPVAPSDQDFQAAQAAADPEQAESAPVRAESAALNAADANAEADLARPARLTQFRSRRRAQFSMVVPALLLIGYGVLLLSESITPDVQEYPPFMLIGAGIGALAIALLARFFINGRRERGLFLLGATLGGGLALTALTADGQLTPTQLWTFSIVLLGAVLLLSYLFARGRDNSAILPALALIVAGLVAIPVADGALSADLLISFVRLAPLILIAAALLWLPRALRERD